MTEILAPAGDETTAYAALDAGADAIYLGLTSFSARSSAENFDVAALCRVCEYAHLSGAKVYVCLNTLVLDGETEGFFECARLAYNAGADALLVQDMFLGKTLKTLYSEITLHLSTQAGCCSVRGARLAKEYGFSRVVLARETPFAEVKGIASVIETEVFVQGALCSCFSGQCYFSSFAGNNSGNRGRCKQPCRKKYAIDRAGFGDFAYALSPSDLSVGKRIRDYVDAGVVSLKIEGRMRRPEYAAAAVKYYRALLDGGDAERAFSALKRAYNRGDYTEGLPFGQTGGFLSRRVQGHIGEEVGFIGASGRGYFVRSDFVPRKGDAFKILRGGAEVGGAAFLSAEKGGFYVSSSARLAAGDSVRVTTSGEARGFALAPSDSKRIEIYLRFVAGEKPTARVGEFVHEGGEPLAQAKNSPLTEEELVACFCRTDALPLVPEIVAETDNAFLPKSALNAFRREFYRAYVLYAAGRVQELPQRTPPRVALSPASGALRAVISADEDAECDILIYKPFDYRRIAAPERRGRKLFLYLPPCFTSADERSVASALKDFDGIYAEGYYGLSLAEEYGVELFAGTGFNLTNAYAVSEVRGRAKFFALSKELSARDQKKLCIAGAFVLQGGAVKLMDLIYCPFGKSCASCDGRERYTLTDEAGREFPLRHYESVSGCRFEVYNCARLEAKAEGANCLTDESVGGLCGVTRGHGRESMA